MDDNFLASSDILTNYISKFKDYYLYCSRQLDKQVF